MTGTNPAPWFAPHQPRAWQAEAWPTVQQALRDGGGPMLTACTGAGKSILQRALLAWACSADRPGVVVIDVPTQALVRQLRATLEESPHLRGHVGTWYGARKRWGRVVVSCRASLETLADEVAIRESPVRLLIVDEAHLQPGRVEAFVDAVKPARRLAVTATPYRSAPEETLALWDRVVVRYTLADALRDGVLVPWATVTHEGVHELDPLCARMVREHGLPLGPGIVDAESIEDAEAFARYLRDDGLRAAAVHSKLSMRERDSIRDDLEAGALDVVVHVSTLVEGVDWPWLRWLCLRRDVGSRVRLVQQVGRGLRTHTGKSECLVLDPHGLMGRIGLHHPEAVGAVEEEIADELEGKAPRPQPSDGPVKAKDVVWVVGRPRLESWLVDCYDLASIDGLVVPRTQTDRLVGLSPASLQQRAALADRIAKGRRIWLPDPLGIVARAVCVDVEAGGSITRGAASCLLAMLRAAGSAAFAQHQQTGQWRAAWAAPIPPLPDGWEVRR